MRQLNLPGTQDRDRPGGSRLFAPLVFIEIFDWRDPFAHQDTAYLAPSN
jgi:hypothetical protein